jgi:hypothetical protein
MKNKKRFFFLYVLALIVLDANLNSVKAQNTEVYEGMTWYLDKEDAFEAAAAENKQVFLLWGRTDCYNCRLARRYMGRDGVKEIVDANYILWYCDANVHRQLTSPVISDYVYPLIGSGDIYLPVICVIDLYDTTVAYGLRTGYLREETMKAFLNQYVSNDLIVSDKKGESMRAYVSGNTLTIEGGNKNETISIYTMLGSLVDRFSKPGGSYSRYAFTYPKGALLVSSSAGWTRKIIVR